MQEINPIVAKVSPNIYAAVKSANINPAQITQVEQMSFAMDQNKKLMAMDPTQANGAYQKLDPNVQQGLKFLYKNASYLNPTNTSVGQNVIADIKSVGKALASPIIGLFKVAGMYNRVINEPYLVAREVAQGQGSIFNAKIWKNAWDGNSVYDDGALKKAVDVFGNTDVVVAKGLLAGKTPGEIIQSYGKVDQGLLDSITKAFNKPNDFRQVMDGVKYAQVSPGRDIARSFLDDKPPANGGLHGDYVSGTTKNISGVLDTAFQIVIDPLTWITGGGNKAASLGEKLAKQVTVAAKGGNYAGGVAQVFEHPDVQNLWQNILGPLLKQYAEAPNKAIESNVFRRISRAVPGYADENTIKMLTKPGENFAPVYDAKTAQKFFESADNANLLLSGRVDGMTLARNGVATAKMHRNYADGFITYLDSVFNATTSKTLGPLKTIGRDMESLDKAGTSIHKALIDTGESLDGFALGYNRNLLSVIKDATGDIGKLKKFGYWVGQQAARSPAGAEIRIGDRAAETANNFTMVARQLFPRDIAEFVKAKFLDSTEDEQVVIVRNLYAGIMMKFGMTGEVKGQELMDKILRGKFGTQAGMATLRKTGVPKEFDGIIEPHSIKNENGINMLQSEGSIQPFQSANAIGALPYNKIAEYVTDVKSRRNLFTAMLGVGNGPFSRKMVDAWSMLTLIPRLGVRSAIDEGMMFALTAPGRDLLAYATRRGHAMGKVGTMFTGSKSAVGPIREALSKLFPKLDPSDAISIAKRQELINSKAIELGISPDEMYDVQKRETIVHWLEQSQLKNLDSEAVGYYLQGLVHHPDMLESISNSLVGNSSLSGNFDEKIMQGILTPTQLDLARIKMGIESGREMFTIDSHKFTDNEVALAHFDNWFKRFVGNKYVLLRDARTGKPVRTLDPAHIFFNNNGLRTAEDVDNAFKEMSNAIGLEFNAVTKQWAIKDQAAVDVFKGLSARTVEMKNSGLNEASIVRDQIGRILVDLRNTFHGGDRNFNDGLLDEIKSMHAKMISLSKRELPPTWSEAAAGMDFDKFITLTKDHRPIGEINTNLIFPGFQEIETQFQKFGNRWMEYMDKQITGMHRQAALNVTYTEVRKNWAGIEKQWVADHVKQMIEDNPTKYASERSKGYLNEQVKSMAQKRFTELGMQHAANEVLKYADNPAIRSNFSYAVRTVGRYYRATEDFQRRMYRLKEVPLRVLYRMRLSHLGLSASGAVYTDQQGNPYVMVPMDSTLYKATDNTIRMLTGKSGYAQPMFNDFTIKLNMINPSFQQDSGLPMLSGPIAGLGMLGIHNILGNTNNALAIEAGNGLSSIALGGFGTNTNLQKVLMPQTVQRIWDMLPFSEQSRQVTTAAQQAMAYNAANGLHLNPNASDTEKAKYIADLRISAHNIIVLRNFLGLISPATPTMVESKGVPDYLKRVGVTSLRSEFYDILNNITKNNTGDVRDPYELALVTFLGKNPGKLIYTVSRTAKQTRTVIKDTQGLNNWAIENQGLIKTYGESAFIFAPQTGKLNVNSYNYLQAAGLVQNKTLEQYYNDLLVAEDKQTYYDIGTNEKAAILAEPNIGERARIIAEATAARDALKTANPLLNAALIGQGNNIGTETKLLSSVEQLVNDPNANIDIGTRQRMASAIKMMNDFIALSTDPSMKGIPNFSDIKKQRRTEIEAALNDLMRGDLYVTEANRAIFKSILNFYSRDTYVAFKAAF